MANNFPCSSNSTNPIKYVDCCTVMDCIDIKSSDNSLTVEINECGVDIKFSGNNLDNILQINDGDCIQMVKEFIGGKLVITPIVDMNCIAESVCDICNPPTCPAPIELTVELA